jgi:hypothetical protein
MISSAEGGRIVNETNIDCIGTVSEQETYKNTHVAGVGSMLNPPSLGAQGSAGQVRYSCDLLAIDGHTRLVKTFESDTQNVPNLKVDTNVGYIAEPGGLISGLHAVEKVGLSLVSTGGNDAGGIGGLCPFIPAGGGGQTCDFSVAGSSMDVKQVSAHTSAVVQATESPYLGYSIDMKGPNAENPYADGKVTAGMIIQVKRGDDGNLQDEESYRDLVTASGLFRFSKSMSYAPQIPEGGMPDPWLLVP